MALSLRFPLRPLTRRVGFPLCALTRDFGFLLRPFAGGLGFFPCSLALCGPEIVIELLLRLLLDHAAALFELRHSTLAVSLDLLVSVDALLLFSIAAQLLLTSRLFKSGAEEPAQVKSLRLHGRLPCSDEPQNHQN